MTPRRAGTKNPYGPEPIRALLPGLAALYAAAADFEESYRYPSIPRGAALTLLEQLVAADPGARVTRSFLEMLREAAGVDRDHASWPLDVLEAARALDLLLERPDAERAVEVLEDREYPWEHLIGLAEERIQRRAGDVQALRRVMDDLRPLVPDAEPSVPRTRRTRRRQPR